MAYYTIIIIIIIIIIILSNRIWHSIWVGLDW